MAEIGIDKVSPKVRNLFNKGFGAIERGNHEFAIDILFQCVIEEPSFLQARRFLRAAEIKVFLQKNPGAMTHHMAYAKNMHNYLKAQMLLKSGKGLEALEIAESLLKVDPLHVQFVLLFADAAGKAELAEAAVQTLEAVKEQDPENIELLKRLGEFYARTGQAKAARAVYEKLSDLCPTDPEVIRAFKNAMALDSITKGGWQEAKDKGENFRSSIKDEKQAVMLEKESKAVKTEQDADDLIMETLTRIETEPSNVNHYRSLARLYLQKQMFDEAVGTLAKALEVSPGDPELDLFLSQAKVQKLDAEIQALTEAGDQAALETKRMNRVQFVFDDLQSRVQRYPQDLKLRYEWGVMLFENDYTNEAIQQFQLSQRGPKQRLRSLYYLGLCFKSKNQFDMAIEQFQKASSEIPTMDDIKKDLCYELGAAHESMGKKDKAIEFFKQIYQVDIAYKDVAQKIEQAYQT